MENFDVGWDVGGQSIYPGADWLIAFAACLLNDSRDNSVVNSSIYRMRRSKRVDTLVFVFCIIRAGDGRNVRFVARGQKLWK